MKWQPNEVKVNISSYLIKTIRLSSFIFYLTVTVIHFHNRKSNVSTNRTLEKCQKYLLHSR